MVKSEMAGRNESADRQRRKRMRYLPITTRITQIMREAMQFFERDDPVFGLDLFFTGKLNREAISGIYFDDCRNVLRIGK